MCTAGLIPERTADPGRAFHLWSSDGAVIFATNSTDPAGMLTGARDVFGPRLFIHQSPTSTTPSHHTHRDSVTQTGDGNPSVALQLHIDGYTEFGDYYPDLVFLLCERQATAGGELSLVDGQRLVDAIASNPTQRALSRFLWDVKLEHGPPDGLRSLGTGKSAPRRRPVASRTCGGRLTVRCHPYQRSALSHRSGTPRSTDIITEPSSETGCSPGTLPAVVTSDPRSPDVMTTHRCRLRSGWGQTRHCRGRRW